MGVSTNWGVLFDGPNMRDPVVVGSYSVPLVLENSQMLVHSKMQGVSKGVSLKGSSDFQGVHVPIYQILRPRSNHVM